MIELFNTFDDITFDDEVHKYYNSNNEFYTSVTTLIHKYETPFDKDYWLPIKAREYNISESQLKYSWDWLNILSKYKGSAIHNYIENFYLNKKYIYPKDQIINEFGYDPIIKDYDFIIKNQFNKFVSISKNKLVPIKPEMIVYDNDYMISGMTDMIFYNIKLKQFQIWDWKTNKKLAIENKYQKMKGPLMYLDQCELNTYSLQLHTYKHIIEKNTGLKLADECFIVWFYEDNDSFQIIKTRDFRYEVSMMIEDFVENKKREN